MRYCSLTVVRVRKLLTAESPGHVRLLMKDGIAIAAMITTIPTPRVTPISIDPCRRFHRRESLTVEMGDYPTHAW